MSNNINVRNAQEVWRKLRLGFPFMPMKRVGNASAFGEIYRTHGNKLMKITKWTRNSEREMKIAKIAGAKNIGPRVYNTRVIQHGRHKLAVMTMNEVPRAISLYSAINQGLITNFKQVENVVAKMHAAGIHHGNLHGGNILVYMANNGSLRLVPINFGASKYHRGIKNSNSATKFAIEKRGWRGGSVMRGRNSGQVPMYQRPGRNQPIRPNANMLRSLKLYYNSVKAQRNGGSSA